MFRRSDIVKNNSLHEEIPPKLKMITSHPVDHFGTRYTPINLKIMFRRSDIVKNNSLHEEIAQKLKIVTPLPVDHFRFEILHFECQKRDQEGGFSQNPLAVRENQLKLKNSGLTSG
jgi:hypothetical protein